MTPRPPCSTLFPYTTLFRSRRRPRGRGAPRRAAPLARARRARPSRGAPGGRARTGEPRAAAPPRERSEEHTSELQSRQYLVCRLLLEKKKHDLTTSGKLWKG